MKIREWIAFLSLTLIWGASFLWIKIAVQEVSPYSLVVFRIMLGLLGLVVFFPLKKPKIPRRLRTWVDLAILGVFSSAVPWLLISWAEQSIDSALAGVLNGTVPLFTIVIAHLFIHDDRMTMGRVMGLLAGFAGVVVLTQRDGGGEVLAAGLNRNLLGQGAMLLASLSYAISGVHARRHLRDVGALNQAFFSMAFSLAILLVVGRVAGQSLGLPREIDTWVALGWLGILGAGVASFVFYYLLHAIGPTRASLVTYTIPVVGVTLGVLVLHERLDWALAVGTFLIVSGVWVVNRKTS
ncbi:MAG: DMT family transporter [Candidatus Latescibacterota bacterium]|nr:MAG: DMT family transporter [Candidatus Latescibacterota bacterium]